VGERYKTPLHLAAEFDQYNVTLHLLSAGALLVTDEAGRIPLHSAAIAGHQRLVNLLLNANAYIEFEDNAIRTPLHHAARMGRTEVVRSLLDVGAKVEAQDGDGRTALHFSSRDDGKMNTTRLLVERGASIHVEDVVGFRPLHYACYDNQQGTTVFLLDQGADLYATDAVGFNAMVHAAANGNAELVNYLVVRTLAPRTYPPSDPVLNSGARQDPTTNVGGLPAWLLALALGVGGGMCIICPSMAFLRRYGRTAKVYQTHAPDDEIDAFMDEVFDYVIGKRGGQEQMIADWNKVPSHIMADLHRPRH